VAGDRNARSGVNGLRPGPIVTNGSPIPDEKTTSIICVGGLRGAANAFGTVCKGKLVKTLRKGKNFDGGIGRRGRASLIANLFHQKSKDVDGKAGGRRLLVSRKNRIKGESRKVKTSALVVCRLI
jgi:hypothetical protein